MYLFDLEDYNCNEVPTDWETYANGIRATIDVYMRCIRNLINDSSGTLPSDFLIKVNNLFIDLNDAYEDVYGKLSDMMAVLTVAPLNCFDKTLYTTYMTSYASFKAIGAKIDILISTGGQEIGIQPDISVSLTTIYPTDGVTNPKTSTCVGVYIKQMDNGSEFRGTVSDDRIVYNNSVPGGERARDGFIRIY
jgi:hypothetical protein